MVVLPDVVHVDFQARPAGPRSDDRLDLVRGPAVPAELPVAPPPLLQLDHPAVHGRPLRLGRAPGRPVQRRLPAHRPRVDLRPQLVEGPVFLPVQLDLQAIRFAHGDGHVHVEVIRVRVDRQQRRIVPQRGLIQKLPGQGQGVLGGHLALETENHAERFPAAVPRFGDGGQFLNGGPFAFQRRVAQDQMLLDVPGIPSRARALAQDVLRVGGGAAAARAGGDLAERVHASPPMAM